MNPFFIFETTLWYWRVLADAMLSDFAVATGQKPALVLIIGGKR